MRYVKKFLNRLWKQVKEVITQTKNSLIKSAALDLHDFKKNLTKYNEYVDISKWKWSNGTKFFWHAIAHPLND